MAQLTEKILKYLSENETVNSLKLAAHYEEDHQKTIGAIKSLQAFGNLVEVKPVSENRIELTEEGELISKKGSYEVHIYKAIPENGIPQSELMQLPNAKIGFSKAMSAGWVLLDKSSTPPMVKKKVEKISDVVQENLKKISSGDVAAISDKEKQEYKKRKLIQEVVVKSFNLSKGAEFRLTLPQLETDLTADMMASGSWQTLQFKEYNFEAFGAPLDCGYLHPLLKVRSEFRQIFLEMGFTEMATNNYIENSFWNFDALFQPQQHPARDAHDTFFISHPKTSNRLPKDYMERVKRVHSKGGYGSKG